MKNQDLQPNELMARFITSVNPVVKYSSLVVTPVRIIRSVIKIENILYRPAK